MKTRSLFPKKFLAAVLLSVCAALAAPQTALTVTLTQAQKLTATTPAANDFLGWSVDVSNNRMIAGATGLLQNGTISGYAIILDRGSDGTWSQSAKLVPSDGAARDQFGRSVAVSGNRAAVGAYKDDHSSQTDAGAVYIFDRGSDGTWSQSAKLVPSDATAGDEFGYSVAISGDRAVVGAHRDDHSGHTDAGAVYIFDRGSDGTWSQSAKLLAHDAYLYEYFGSDVAISGSRVIVGARDENGLLLTDSGAVYIYEEIRSSSPYWTQVAKLKASDAAQGDRFGHSVAISGGRVVVGTPQASSTDAGAAYVFTRSSDGTWSQSAKLTASDGSSDDRFGFDVDLSGDTAIVGTSTSGNSAYVFTRSSSDAWSQDQKLVPAGDGSGGTSGDGFGWSVSISSGRAAVGAPGDDGSGNATSNSGSAYVYNFGTTQGGNEGDGEGGGEGGNEEDNEGDSEGGGEGGGEGGNPGTIPEPTSSDATYTFSSQAHKLTGSGATANDLLGWSVALSGNRMIAGASGLINGQSAGYAYIYERSTSGAWVERAKLSANDGAARDQFGHSVAISGSRAVVGAYRDDLSRGSAYIFERNSSGRWTQVAKLTASDGATTDNFGWSVALSGSRTVVGAPWHDLPGKSGAGAVYVFDRGSSGTWSQTAKLTATDGSGFDRFGQSVAMSGSRIIVGAHQESSSAYNSGAAYIFARSSTGAWTQTAKIKAGDPGRSDEFGYSVALSGSRAVVGAHRDFVNRSYSAGSAYVFDRSSSGTWSQTARLTAGGEAATGANFGQSVAVLGGTAIVGTPGGSSGSAYVFDRSSSGAWSQTRKLAPTGDGEEGTAGDGFGQSVALSSEGRMAVGATGDDGRRNTLSRAGSVYLYGTETDPAPVPDGEENPVPGGGETGTGGTPTGGTNPGGGTPGPAVDPAVEAAWNEVLNNLDTQGSSVAISGDAAIVGSDGDTENGELSGSAVVFERSTDGTWSRTRKLTASDGKARGLFGRSVAVSGSRAVVGAIGDDTNGQLAGAVYVFDKGSSGTWSQTAKFVAGDGTGMDFFGRSVSVSGDTVIAGADGYDEDESVTGAAYIFERSSDGAWSQIKILASDGESGDNFGESVGVSGSGAIVGAPRVDDNGEVSGAAYIFEKDSSGTWTQTVKLTPNDGESGDFFGESVSISGDRAIVGSELDDDEGPSTGAAYIFERGSDGTWAQAQKLTAGDDAESDDQFGESVSISGDRAIVGVNNADSAYVYKRDSEGIWTLEEKLTPETAASDYFGDAVAVSGDSVVLISSLTAASIYEISSEEEPVARVSETVTLPGSGKLTASDGETGDLFGVSVSVSGARAIVGASVNSVVSRKSGSVYVFEKGSGGAWSQTKLTASDIAFNDAFGRSVSVSGARAIAGAQGANDDKGAAYVFERSSGGTWSQVSKLTASDGAASDAFGHSVAVSGSRAIVGAPRDDDGGSSSGTAYVFERNSGGTWAQTKLTASDAAADDLFGVSVSVSGARAIVGAIRDDDNGSNSGAAYVFERGSEGTWAQTKLTASDGAENDAFGQGVSVSGDIAVVGAVGDSDNGTRAGAAYVFERSSGGTWLEVSKLAASDAADRDTFGQSVSVSGNRIIVGAETNGDNGAVSGSAYMFERNSDGTWSETAKILAADGAAGDTFGNSVAISGGTAFIGAVGDDNGRGSAYVYEPTAVAASGSDTGQGAGAGADDRSRREVARLSIAAPGQGSGRSAPSSAAGGCAVSSAGSGGDALLATLALMLIPAFAGFRKRKQI